MTLVLTAPPTPLSLVSLAEAKLHCKIDVTDDDALITSFINAAYGYIDGLKGVGGRAILPQTWQLYLDAFPVSGSIKIPLGPITAVTAVEYLDPIAGTLTTFAPTNYQVDITGDYGWVVLTSTASWPSILNAINAVRVTFAAGYASGAQELASAKVAALLLIGQWNQNRELVVTDKRMEQLPFALQALLAQFGRVAI